ncbi:hypothetical protein [Halobacterium litoreum]|uniref:SipW-cognate class signal peptide n=1 Tax=Halobacterium litoreum TaxID=2039234 RepID=A0ABD5NDB5_9EURY|nr:hypothetical protein [Halobacterium litoreum]UHH14060.1 hypothetical protein LT972_03440 [Halobacterium litoreum]
MTPPIDVTRRRLLASVAATGAASFAGVGALSEDAVAYTDAATVGDGPAVRVDWRETYNGAVVDDGAAGDGPVLDVGNAQPGDSGALAFRVAGDGTDPVRVAFSLALTANEENGRIEPEREAGDDTPTGELADALEIAAWYDTGAFGVSRLGGCDGERGVGETTLVDGTLRDADAALADGVRLGGDCLGSDQQVCVGLSWSLPASVGSRIQTDSVETDLAFAVEACGGDSS